MSAQNIQNIQDIQHIMKPLSIVSHDWGSLYLKMWADGVVVDGREIHKTEDLKWLVEEVLYMGKVSRIDVKTSRTKSGSQYRAAFIHFHMWDDKYGKFVRDSINHKGKYKVNVSHKTSEPFQNTSHRGEPNFVFYKNINPVQEGTNTDMNKEQLAARCINLEKALKEKSVEVEKFIQEERAQLVDTIEKLREAISLYEPYATPQLQGFSHYY